MFGKLICWWKGHKRAKFVRADGDVRVLACPRCGHETRRKSRAKAPQLQAVA